MEIKNFYELNKSESVIFADREALFVFLQTSSEKMLKELYERIYATPEIYAYFMRTLDIDSLRIFKDCVKQVKSFDVNNSAIRTIIKDTAILTEDEAFAVLYSTKTSSDIIMDDPRKAELCKDYGVNVLRPSDIVASAAFV